MPAQPTAYDADDDQTRDAAGAVGHAQARRGRGSFEAARQGPRVVGSRAPRPGQNELVYFRSPLFDISSGKRCPPMRWCWLEKRREASSEQRELLGEHDLSLCIDSSVASDALQRCCLPAARMCSLSQLGTPCGELVSAAAAEWASARGVRTRFQAATFGHLRGGAASEALSAGDVVAELLASSLVTARTARSSPQLQPVLAALPGGGDDDTALLLWTLRERGDSASAFSPLLTSLPASPIHTGLTLPFEVLHALRGTLLHAETTRLRSAAREEYETLFPALLDAFPAALAPRSAFSWEAYCVAVELWQSYAVRVILPGEKQTCSALLPSVLLLNHSSVDEAHIVRFSTFDDDGVLRLRTRRPCSAGEQLHLCYGALPNAQLLLYYGFTLPDNPLDEFPLAFDPPEAPEEPLDEEAAAAEQLRASLIARLGLEHSLRPASPLPKRLLSALRLVVATHEELRLVASQQEVCTELAAAPSALGDDNEGNMLLTLQATLEAVYQDLPAVPDGGDGLTCPSMRHAAVYIAGQRAILEHAQAECSRLLALLDQ